MLAVRFVDRVGKGVRTAPRDALLAREAAPEDRAYAFGFHRSMDNAGAVLGPLVAMALLALRPGDIRFVFAMTLVPGLLSVLAVTFGVTERDADRVGRGRALALGWALYAIAYAGFGAARTPLEAAPALLAYGLYYGLSEGTELALVASLAPTGELGRAYGWFYLVTGMLALPASLWFGVALDRGYTGLAFGVSAALALAASAGLLVWQRGRRD